MHDPAAVQPRVAWIGLGSNLERPERQVRGAVEAIAAIPAVRLLAVSPRYRTAPVGGPPGQPDFCNACAAVATTRTPLSLLDALQAIEADHGRVRDVRWGPRTLDLDMLAFDERRRAGPRLELPHPRARERAFVLVPLADIAPTLTLGSAGRVVDLLAGLDTADVRPWDAA